MRADSARPSADAKNVQPRPFRAEPGACISSAYAAAVTSFCSASGTASSGAACNALAQSNGRTPVVAVVIESPLGWRTGTAR